MDDSFVEDNPYWLPAELWHAILDFVDKSHHHILVSTQRLFYHYVMAHRHTPQTTAELERAARLGHTWDIVSIPPTSAILHWERATIASVQSRQLKLFVKLWHHTLYQWTELSRRKHPTRLMVHVLINDELRDDIAQLLSSVLSKAIRYHAMPIITWLKHYFDFESERSLVRDAVVGDSMFKIYKHGFAQLMPSPIHNEFIALRAFYGALTGGHLTLARTIYHAYPDMVARDPETAMHYICRGGSVAAAQWLLSLYDVIPDDEEWTNIAIVHCHLELAQYFYARIPRPMDQYVLDNVFTWCVASGNKAMVTWAESEGYEVNAYDFVDALTVSRSYFEWLCVHAPRIHEEFEAMWSNGEIEDYFTEHYNTQYVTWVDRDLLEMMDSADWMEPEVLMEICESAGREDLMNWIESGMV